jgi:hypothetical protein
LSAICHSEERSDEESRSGQFSSHGFRSHHRLWRLTNRILSGIIQAEAHHAFGLEQTLPGGHPPLSLSESRSREIDEAFDAAL